MLALTAALVGPYFVDWTNYRADFEREASRILGRNVEVRGSATARLLPFPSVSFSDVVVTDDEGEVVMTADTFSMDAELMPFLSGEILIFDMRLERPEAVLTVDEDGAIDWAARPAIPVQAQQVTLESVSVSDGQISVRHLAGARVHVLSDINARISARTLVGPWRAEGDLRLDGLPATVVFSTGTADGGATRMRLRAQPHGYPLTLEAEGEASIGEDGATSVRGQFRIAASSGAPRQQAVAQPQPAAQAIADYRISGAFEFDHRRLAAEEVRFEIGPAEDPYTAEGSASIAIGADPRFRLRAQGVQLRVEEATGGAASFDERLAALRGFIGALPRPAIPGRIDLELPAVIAGDTTIREVRLAAEPSDAGWRIAALRATLPGRATLEASGDLSVGEELGFDGSLLLAINQPSGFAAWLSREVDDAIRRLPVAGFSAEVELGERRQVLRDLELALGGSVFRGEVDSRQPADSRPSLDVRLHGEGLDVEGLAAFASLFVSESGRNRLADRDIDLDLAAEAVTLAGLSAEGVEARLRLRDEGLDIDALRIASLAGAEIWASGWLRDLAGFSQGAIEADIAAADLAPLVSVLAERLPDNGLIAGLHDRALRTPMLLADARLDAAVEASGGTHGAVPLEFSLSGSLGGNTIGLRGSSESWTGDPAGSPLSLSASIDSVDAADLLALAGVSSLPLGMTGRTSTEISLSGLLSDGAELELTARGEDTQAALSGQLAQEPGGIAYKGSARLTSDDLGPWLMTAAVSAPGLEAGLPVDISAELDYSAGLLVASKVEGAAAGSGIRGELNVEMRQDLPHLTGELYLDTFDLSLLAEMVLGSEAVQPVSGKWPDTPFRPSLAMPFTGDLDITIDRLTYGEALALAQAQLGARLGSDGVAFSDLSAQAFGGRLSGLGELRNDQGTALLSAQLRLEEAEAGALLPNSTLGGRTQVTATLGSTGKTVGALVAALSGSGTLGVADLILPGIAPDAFEALLITADVVGREIDAGDVEAFAPRLVRSGDFAAGEVELAFSIASGALRSPPVQIVAPQARLTAELRADFTRMMAEADATLQYDPGIEALVGSEPAVRFSVSGHFGDLSARVDTEPLAQYLTQRALEREQQRVEDMQAVLLEQQRIRREVRYFAALGQERLDRAEQQRLAEEEARRMLEEETRRRAEEEARRIAAEEAERRAREEADIRAEEERRQAEEERRRAEEEARAAEEAERRRLAEEAQAAEEARLAEEAEQRRTAEERLHEQGEARARAARLIHAAEAEGAALDDERARRAAIEERERRDRLHLDIESILQSEAADPAASIVVPEDLAPDAVLRAPLAAPLPTASEDDAPAAEEPQVPSLPGVSGMFVPQPTETYPRFSDAR